MAKTQHKRKVHRKRKAKGTNRKSVNSVPLGTTRKTVKLSPTQHLKKLLNIPPVPNNPPPSAAPLHSLPSSRSPPKSSSRSPPKINVTATKEFQKFLRQQAVAFIGNKDKKNKKASGKRRRKSKGRK